MKRCRQCNTKLPVTARFCHVCGSAQTGHPAQAPSSSDETTDGPGGVASAPSTHEGGADATHRAHSCSRNRSPRRRACSPPLCKRLYHNHRHTLPVIRKRSTARNGSFTTDPERVTSSSGRKGRNVLQIASSATSLDSSSQASAEGVAASASSPATTRLLRSGRNRKRALRKRAAVTSVRPHFQ